VRFHSEAKGCVKFYSVNKGCVKFRRGTNGCVRFYSENKDTVKLHCGTKVYVRLQKKDEKCRSGVLHTQNYARGEFPCSIVYAHEQNLHVCAAMGLREEKCNRSILRTFRYARFPRGVRHTTRDVIRCHSSLYRTWRGQLTA
jgi:hypothetical protein